ncbi:MAG: O-antigen ligase family protein [Patescibacteria group bacterium]|nr:O-antigen ligase family protein [Patescibacteria group bacterium]
MGLKTVLFALLFLAGCLGTFIGPIWPLLGYIAHYCIGPERQWWHEPLASLEVRYSMTLGALTLVAMIFHAGQLRFGRSPFCGHEWLLVGLLAMVWLSVLIGPPAEGFYTHADHPSVKFTKLVAFALMLTHIVTDRKNLDRLVWVLVLSAMVLGMQAWDTPYDQFAQGRLESVGGADFREANFLGGVMAALLWLIGVQFLRCEWRGKIVCFLAGGFTANAVILTRSRGAMVGLVAGGVAAVIMAPKRYRLYLIVGLALGAAGFYYLTDDRFWERSATITVEEGERDASAQSRIDLTRIGLQMWRDRPWGIGAGNYFAAVGAYAHEQAGRDPHNTYIRALVELGAQGFVMLALLIGSAALMLYRVRLAAYVLPERRGNDMLLLSYGFVCALATMLACAMFITFTYIEFWVWLLMMPVCLQRVMDNEQLDAGLGPVKVKRWAFGGRSC